MKNARSIGRSIEKENSIEKAISFFHENLPEISCDLCRQKIALIYCFDCKMKFCDRDDYIIHFEINHLIAHRRHRNLMIDWKTRREDNAIGSTAQAAIEGVHFIGSNISTAVYDVFTQPFKHYNKSGFSGIFLPPPPTPLYYYLFYLFILLFSSYLFLFIYLF